ncbi:putative permease [Bremerella volcania]|uniref:Putative permease n=1 Tax=Bremerella volcania TaxID=2527984 RepID=A0A518C9I1_9BACT|nr:permease [Bremerella volcania]QDU75886.1 putative permease [Bremerella volcania]
MAFGDFWHTFSVEQSVVTLLITMIRILVESSATILIGILGAAAIRVSGGYSVLRKWLGPAGSFERTFRLLAACLCVPVCALGVIPIAKELSDGGMPRRDLAVLWLVAPLLNPLSILYAISVLPIWQCGVFLLVACVYAVVVAEVAGRFSDEPQDINTTSVPEVTNGTTRLWNAAVAAGQIVTGWSIVYIVLGMVVSGLVVGLVPSGAFEKIFSYQNTTGPLETMALTGPQMVTPITFTMAVSAIHSTHLAFACAIVLQLLGVAWGGGTVLAMRSVWGAQRTLALLLVTIVLATTVSYGTYSVFPPAPGDEEETHGLDTLARPYHATFGQFSLALSQQLNHTDLIMQAGTTLLGILTLWGIVVRSRGLHFREDPIPSAEAKPSAGRWNVELTPGQVGMSLIGVAAFGVIMLMYSIFPGVEESFEQMKKVSADAVIAVKTNKTHVAQQKLAEWDTVAARMPVGWVLRMSVPNSQQASEIRALRELLWKTRQQFAQAELTDAEVKERGAELIDQFQSCRVACLGDKT